MTAKRTEPCEPLFNFDQPVARENTDSDKWRRYQQEAERQGRDIIPMWVADMDFVSPPAVLDALKERVEHGVFGYGKVSAGMTDAFCHWYATQHNWQIDPKWIVWLPGLVGGLHAVARTFGEAGSAVMTHIPVYPPFLKVAERTHKQLQAVPMREGPRWSLDLEAMQAQLKSNTRLFMFCNPHNPTGRVFSREELQQLSNFIVKNDLVVCSDEIHCDLVLDKSRRHIPLASLNPEIAARTITLLAPSKTFNIAGLACSAAVIPDHKLRLDFKHSIQGFMPDVNLLGFVAAEAAYRNGAVWREQLVCYLAQNRNRLMRWAEGKQQVDLKFPEATYLAWLDLRATGQEKPAQWLLKETGVALSEGADFGLPGFARLNFGCSLAQLDRALERLDQILN
ncbi:MalY/PatB family protein [Oceanospirillum linum]|uniref:cysteine-S-conjugate beta-lyase n=1 Tax=Oceanospirillum linum TaxID=966 RepID=A0A1T1HG67_OCELI|nr:PatB family C-S lyase [Oceanospirillum linum]OOV88841.1 hypothetical protein BTA35_0205070 [Oceanospirillum linum]SEG49668.1 cystathione beta-lyase [Oleiphilus messinensis]SMP22825.1 cystathione beta-lyase [Oceanospirillum linum]